MRLTTSTAFLGVMLGVLCVSIGCQPVPVVAPSAPPTPLPGPSPTVSLAASESVPSRDDPTPITSQPETIGMPAATATSEAGLQRARRAAQRIAARFFKIEASAVAVRGVKTVIWPDSSLACGPLAGQRPVSTPGYLAMVEVAGQVYAVHMTERGRGIVCLEPASE